MARETQYTVELFFDGWEFQGTLNGASIGQTEGLASLAGSADGIGIGAVNGTTRFHDGQTATNGACAFTGWLFELLQGTTTQDIANYLKARTSPGTASTTAGGYMLVAAALPGGTPPPSTNLWSSGVWGLSLSAITLWIPLNFNDDNGNGTNDMAEVGPVAGEKDTVRIDITVNTTVAGSGGTLKLEESYAGSANNIKLWTTMEKGTPISLPKVWSGITGITTNTVWVEGTNTSSTVWDTALTATYTTGSVVRCRLSATGTVFKLNLILDVDRNGVIDNDDELRKNRALTNNPPGPYVTLNNDNDNGNFDAAGNGIPDNSTNETDVVTNENDLVHVVLTMEPNVETGYISLSRESCIWVWSNPWKGSNQTVLCGSSETNWNLASATDRTNFHVLGTNLWVEGRSLGNSRLSAFFHPETPTPPVSDRLGEQVISLPVCPGAPQEYVGWGTMALPMAGGQIHCQWRHFSECAPPLKYRIYIDTSNATYDPFSNGVPTGLTPIVLLNPGTNAAQDRGYIQIGSTNVGAFYIDPPERSDEGTNYWFLIRAVEVTNSTTYESQNRNGYKVKVDYPDADSGGRNDLTNLNFYVNNCGFNGDVFIGGQMSVCAICSSITCRAGASMWRVARSTRREQGTTGYYYADGADSLTDLKNACEGPTGIFETNRAAFGDWTDTDSNGVFFLLVTSLTNYSGYFALGRDQVDWWTAPGSWNNKGNYADMVYLRSGMSTNRVKVVAAHEIQHDIHYFQDPLEALWVNEGCSEYAIELNNLADFNIGKFGEIPAGETAPRASKIPLTLFDARDVYRLFSSCPLGSKTNEGYKIFRACYEKVALWTHYLDANIDHKPTKTLKTLVADPAVGIAGVNNLIDVSLLGTNGPFVKWTVANYANQINTNAADREYNYTGGWTNVGVTAYTNTAFDVYLNRSVRNLAADYVKYNCGATSGVLAVYLKDVDDWTSIVVNAVRIDNSGGFKDVKWLGGTSVSTNEYRYPVPDVLGTNYYSAVVVVTHIVEGETEHNYQIKARVE